MSNQQKVQRIQSLSPREAKLLPYLWELSARPKQRLPSEPFFVWLILAGRGFGKTRTGAETVRAWINKYPMVNIIGATADDARDIMIEGESGILAICPKDERPTYVSSKRRLEWQNGATSLIFTADEPERLRGKQHMKVWADELACVVADSKVATSTGAKNIDAVRIGDYVQTRKGFRKVLDAWQSSPSAEVYKLTASNGSEVIGTPNHPVFVEGKGFIPLRFVSYGDILNTWTQKTALLTMEKGIGSMADTTQTAEAEVCTGKFIARPSERYQTDLLSIIKTETKQTIRQIILRLCLSLTTEENTGRVSVCGAKLSAWYKLACNGSTDSHTQTPVIIAGKNIKLLEQGLGFARIIASLHLGEKIIRSANRLCVKIAEKVFCFTKKGCDTALSNADRQARKDNLKFVPIAEKNLYQKTQEMFVAPQSAEVITVKSIEKQQDKQSVYNLSVEGEQEYYANGILVHNSWRYPEAWTQAMMGLRLGNNPQAVVTTTPRPTKAIQELMKDTRNIITTGTTYENRSNLAAGYFDYVIKKYEGTRLGRQELLAEILSDNPGALWRREDIDKNRVVSHPDLNRVVVGVDPSATSGGDEAGIITAGRAGNDYYTLADDSVQGSPETWARAAITAFHRHKADCIVAEKNNGGEMVESVIRQAVVSAKAAGENIGNVPVKLVWASRGKVTRAEPISAISENDEKTNRKGRDHHVGNFPALEDELCSWTQGDDSPNRLDAKVWAITALLSETVIETVDNPFFN